MTKARMKKGSVEILFSTYYGLSHMFFGALSIADFDWVCTVVCESERK